MAKVLLTGSTGFVGLAVERNILAAGKHHLAVCRRSAGADSRIETYVVGDIGHSTDFSQALKGKDVVIHLAAQVPASAGEAEPTIETYRSVNVEGTRSLALQAAQAGVKRFVYISTVKVNGEHTSPGRAFGPDCPPNPQDAYGLSKLEGEKALCDVCRDYGLDFVIIRVPLVYGNGMKGNLAKLVNLVDRGWPLPFGRINNRRSLIFVGNLADLISHCIDHPKATNRVLMASDGVDLSTTALIRQIAKARRRSVRLVPVPFDLVSRIASVTGKTDIAQRLFGSLEVDIKETVSLLNWTPPFSVEQSWHRSIGLEQKHDTRS